MGSNPMPSAFGIFADTKEDESEESTVIADELGLVLALRLFTEPGEGSVSVYSSGKDEWNLDAAIGLQLGELYFDISLL